ncbi:hypothetical protein PRIPAC_78437 [Pristionchus pacificus]|uniref:G protein-coupled receptor n=1 Tax=Pristionchus pacificus TaxID=54126 RepID=A0A2A6CLD8_PRIPA|nr:hypothetical protein PRIPAC_78437 [Pristionchus pacificus]|eukprot:PDM78887.1 G protein-coupled receptor [Pristionchus pacificus]
MPANPLYSWAYTDPAHAIFITTTTSVSLFSNGLLMYIIHTAAGGHFGSNRHLLTFFAMCDIATAVGHAFLQPYLHMTTSGFYFFPRHGGVVIQEVPVDTVFCLMFIATFYQTFLVLAFHFVYRYTTITRGISGSISSGWSKTTWIAIGVVVYVVYITAYLLTVAIGMTPSEDTRNAVPVEIQEEYDIDLTDPRRGFTVLAVRRVIPTTNVVYWSVESLISLAFCAGLFGTTAVVIMFCIYQTSAAIKSATTQLSPATRKMHGQLFRALLIQTAVPCIFSYTPLSVILLFGPVTDVSLGAFGNALIVTTAIFPSVDCFFVLYFIVRFRIAVVRLFNLPNSWGVATVEVTETTAFTSAASCLIRSYQFDGLISERVCHIYSYTTTMCSLIANSLLIIVLMFTKLNHVLFGSFFFANPLFSSHSTTFTAISPPWVSWLQRNPWRNWITLAVIVDVLYAGSIVVAVGMGRQPNEENRRAFAPVLKEAYGIDLNADNAPGYLALTYWIPQEDGSKKFTPLPVFTMLFAFSVIFTAVIVILLCLVGIFKEMRKTNCVHSVLSAVLCVATLGLMSMELFPIVDPLLIIAFITGFNAILPRCLHHVMLGPIASTVVPTSATTSGVSLNKNSQQIRMPT